MSTNNSNTDTHIYNIINNPSKEFTEPCECCGVSEFQLGVKHAEERIIKLLEDELPQFTEKNPGQPVEAEAWGLRWAIRLIKGENK